MDDEYTVELGFRVDGQTWVPISSATVDGTPEEAIHELPEILAGTSKMIEEQLNAMDRFLGEMFPKEETR